MRPSRRSRTLFVIVTVTLGLIAACSSSGKGAAGPETSTTTTAAPSLPTTNCDPAATASYGPVPGAQANDTKLTEIRQHGKLIVGVSADTYGFGFRNPFTGNIEGFDIDIAHAVAKAIFGDPNAIEFRVMSLAQRQPAVVDNSVDMVADVFTMTCDRWNDPNDSTKSIAFSSQYFAAEKKLLVATDSKILGIDDLSGKKVCVSQGSTTEQRIAEHPDVVSVPVPQNSDCMVLFQSGQVDAVAGDVPILTGFARQDPYAEIVGASLSDEPYGLGVNKDDVDFVRFINSVLEDMRTDGQWADSYDFWIATPTKTQVPPPPPAVYGRG
jgi:polar amino acid transport system substrate-binding protein